MSCSDRLHRSSAILIRPWRASLALDVTALLDAASHGSLCSWSCSWPARGRGGRRCSVVFDALLAPAEDEAARTACVDDASCRPCSARPPGKVDVVAPCSSLRRRPSDGRPGSSPRHTRADGCRASGWRPASSERPGSWWPMLPTSASIVARQGTHLSPLDGETSVGSRPRGQRATTAGLSGQAGPPLPGRPGRRRDWPRLTQRAWKAQVLEARRRIWPTQLPRDQPGRSTRRWRAAAPPAVGKKTAHTAGRPTNPRGREAG